MKKQSMLIALMALAAILSACAGAKTTPTPSTTVTPSIPQVSVKGKAMPATWVALSAQTGGVVLEVLVKPGDELSAGDVLIRIDPESAQLAMQRAKVALKAAQSRLARVKATPRPEQIVIAEAQIDAAQAAFDQAAAQRDLLKSGTIDAEIATAQANITAAEAGQRVASDAYDQAIECYDIPGIDKANCKPAEEQARLSLDAADEALAAAEAQLDALVEGKDARLNIADAAVQAAEARLDAAQAELELLQAGATAEEIAVVQAAVDEAGIVLSEARAALERCEVRAPITGTVSAIHARAGELVVLGQPLVVLGDLSTLQIETTNLDDVDVTSVQLGQSATITFNALSGQTFTGRVIRISPMAERDLSGGYNYTVIIALDELAPAIRWGMDAFVTIE